MVSIRAGTKVIAFELGLPLMPSTKASLMLKFARLAAGNPMQIDKLPSHTATDIRERLAGQTKMSLLITYR